jgi:hypothetical protein
MSFPCFSLFVKAFPEANNAARYINDISVGDIWSEIGLSALTSGFDARRAQTFQYSQRDKRDPFTGFSFCFYISLHPSSRCVFQNPSSIVLSFSQKHFDSIV